MMRLLVTLCPLAAMAAGASANTPPAPPVITEPSIDGRTLNHEDVHMETGPFSDPDPGDAHRCTDWEIWTVLPSERVWSALCAQGLSSVHIHLGDGVFSNSHAGRVSLQPATSYILRARHRDSSEEPSTEWSAWTVRTFGTGELSAVFPLEMDDVADSPLPALADTTGMPALLGAGDPPGALFVETGAGGLLLQLRGALGANEVTNPPPLGAHAPARVRFVAGSAGLVLPECDLSFTEHTGTDRTVHLPAMNLAPLQAATLWIAANGATYYGQASQTQPDFGALARGAPVPWETQPGFRVEVFASGFTLPVNIAFVPQSGPNPEDPFFYVSELYGTIKVVRRNGSVGVYAANLLNFNPTGQFPGSGEQGVAGIAVDPATGDVIAGMLYDSAPPDGDHYPRIVRFTSADGGQTAATQATLRDFPGETQGQSHQISALSIGPDGKLYVHMGDGFAPATAQDLDSFRGKVLRMNLDGSAPPDNPLFDPSNGITARDFLYAWGFRNPFGGAWRQADASRYVVENGPSVDRFARLVPARNYGWNGTDASMATFALYNWDPSRAPVNVAFVQPGTFGGSGFPADRMGRAYVSESGPTWATGPQALGKRITEWVLDASGALAGGPNDLAVYNGAGKATVAGLAAGPDGLYFTDLYKDADFASPIDSGSNVLRVRWAGAADFGASVVSGVPPLTVQFTDLSTVPSPSAWEWTFGDGGASTQQHPTHTYTSDGHYDVRLRVTGSGGVAVHQRSAFIRVGLNTRVAMIGGNDPPAPADTEVAEFLRERGFAVELFEDDPQNRPSAHDISHDFDLAVISSTVSSDAIAGEFRSEHVPLVFWESALLRPGRETLMEDGASVEGATSIDILAAMHPITQGLAPGPLAVFQSPGAMSVGRGFRPPGALLLATRAGAADDAAILVAEEDAVLTGYSAPARRVFLFLEDAGIAGVMPAALQILERSACWAVDGGARVTMDPQDASVAPGATAVMSVVATGVGPLSYQWRRAGADLVDDGRISGAKTPNLVVQQVSSADEGSYDCLVTNACAAAASAAASLAVPGSCYANCDGSTTPPVVNVADFTCFLQKFASGDPYANCDGSTVPPAVNVADFTCFLQRVAAGCP